MISLSRASFHLDVASCSVCSRIRSKCTAEEALKMEPDIWAHIELPTVESQESHGGGTWKSLSRSFSVVSGPVRKHSPLTPPEFVFRVPMKGHSYISYTSN